MRGGTELSPGEPRRLLLPGSTASESTRVSEWFPLKVIPTRVPRKWQSLLRFKQLIINQIHQYGGLARLVCFVFVSDKHECLCFKWDKPAVQHSSPGLCPFSLCARPGTSLPGMSVSATDGDWRFFDDGGVLLECQLHLGCEVMTIAPRRTATSSPVVRG